MIAVMPVFFFLLIASALVNWPASAGSCASNEGCCIKGVQYQENFFPLCKSGVKDICIKPSKAFLKARAACRKAFTISGTP